MGQVMYSMYTGTIMEVEKTPVCPSEHGLRKRSAMPSTSAMIPGSVTKNGCFPWTWDAMHMDPKRSERISDAPPVTGL